MRMIGNFSGCRVLSYCVMSNYFHILVEVPPLPEGGSSDAELLRRLGIFYGENFVKSAKDHLRREWAGCLMEILNGWLISTVPSPTALVPGKYEIMEPVEPPWHAIKEWIPDDEPDLDWFNGPRNPFNPDPEGFDQSPTWQSPEIRLDDERILVPNTPDAAHRFRKPLQKIFLGKAAWKVTFATNEFCRETSEFRRIPAFYGAFPLSAFQFSGFQLYTIHPFSPQPPFFLRLLVRPTAVSGASRKKQIPNYQKASPSEAELSSTGFKADFSQPST